MWLRQLPVKANSIWEGFAKGINADDKSGEEIEIMRMCDLWSEWRSMY